MRKALRWMMVALLAAAAPSVAAAQWVPEMLPYQGFLADQNGSPIDGSVNITVRVYDSSDAVAPVWEESLQNVSVSAGYFALNLGQIQPLVADVVAGRTRYLGLSVNGDAEATPRQAIGSVPYAFYAGDSAKLGGQPAALYVTTDRLNQEFANRNYVTEARVIELIGEHGGGGGEGGLNEAQVNALIDARGYLSQAAIEALIDGRGYVTEAQVAALIDARNYVNTDQVNALIDARNYVTTDQVNALIDARNYVTQADVEALVDARVQNQINALRQELVQQIQAAAAATQPFILGRSNDTRTGRMAFNGATGMAAANAMCQATFADEPTAHLCTFGEVGRALGAGAYNRNGNFDGQATWTVAEVTVGNFNGTRRNSCYNLMYNSGDAATGTQLTVRLNDTSDGGGGGLQGDTFEVLQNRACADNLPVLCCR